MRIVFVGASKFGLRCLRKVLGLSEIEVVGVVTNPKTFAISYRPQGVNNVNHADFHSVTNTHKIPIWNMTGKMTDPNLVEQLVKWNPDFILVVGWYHMIPKSIRQIAPTAGLHASLLPDYSGGAPLVWAIINGEEKTGISFFLMEDNVDSGPIIGQKEETIFPNDSIATLYARIEKKGLDLLQEQLPKIASGTVKYLPQDETQRRTMPQRSPEDGKIDWKWSAQRVYNFVRAQTKPYPGAFSYVKGNKLIIWEADPDYSGSIFAQPPGKILNPSNLEGGHSFSVMCGDGRKLTVHDFDIESNYKISIKDLIKINSSEDDLILGKLSYTENPSVETDSV